MDCRKECMGTAIIAHGYAAPVFQSSKHILYLVTLKIQLFVVIFLNSFIFSIWNALRAVLAFEMLANP